MKWLLNDVFDSHAGAWLALGAKIVFAFALRMASSRVAVWLLTRKRDTDAAEGEYWRIHEGE